MNNQTIDTGKSGWIAITAAIIATVSFFLTWVKWDDTAMQGVDMPLGQFFATAESKFGLGNPFPEFDFGLVIFWLIPVFLVYTLISIARRKRPFLLAGITAALSLSLITVFLLFSQTLISLGAKTHIEPALYIHGISIAIFILAYPGSTWTKKLLWLIIGPVFAFAGFKLIEKHLENKTHGATDDIRAEYTVSSVELISEFTRNDTAANKKYLEKVMEVNGPAYAVDILPDSTSTIRFADSTGSYAIFSLEKSEFLKAREIKPGSNVSLKGVCSGSMFSEILGTTSISFKRAILNKK